MPVSKNEAKYEEIYQLLKAEPTASVVALCRERKVKYANYYMWSRSRKKRDGAGDKRPTTITRKAATHAPTRRSSDPIVSIPLYPTDLVEVLQGKKVFSISRERVVKEIERMTPEDREKVMKYLGTAMWQAALAVTPEGSEGASSPMPNEPIFSKSR